MTGYCTIKWSEGAQEKKRKDDFGLGEAGRSLGWDFQ